ncbi:hypothetical protein [Moheibacter lacus]|uniref:Uncharacterized protein n=1 Tax=Moheibacter lacus TaxID=2745851 RepID=A0A838ZIV3_9FLAO|nr:hypothetical protein [Moheibacter lacus]MBA5628284.1 hypothetical protein [Moheibacter lacus]
MKKVIYLILGLIIALLLGIIIWFNLPIELKYKSEIEYGNSLIDNIKKYKGENQKLPEEGDWKTLKNLHFNFNEIGSTIPEYILINDEEFELVFVEGFDPPYLFYNSKTNKWNYDFPSIPERFLKE